MTAQNAAVQKQKMHQRITEVHLLTAKIEQDPHLQFLIFMHYSCIYAGKKYVYFDHDGFVSLLDSR